MVVHGIPSILNTEERKRGLTRGKAGERNNKRIAVEGGGAAACDVNMERMAQMNLS